MWRCGPGRTITGIGMHDAHATPTTTARGTDAMHRLRRRPLLYSTHGRRTRSPPPPPMPPPLPPPTTPPPPTAQSPVRRHTHTHDAHARPLRRPQSAPSAVQSSVVRPPSDRHNRLVPSFRSATRLCSAPGSVASGIPETRPRVRDKFRRFFFSSIRDGGYHKSRTYAVGFNRSTILP